MRPRGARIRDLRQLTMELLDCVSFLLVDGDRFLVERRRMDRVVDPGAIAIPGGHMELRETQEQALARELHEELGLTDGATQFFCTLLNPSEEFRKLFYYAVTDWSGEIENNEAAELIWLTFDDLERLDLAVDHVAIGEYRRVIRRDGP